MKATIFTFLFISIGLFSCKKKNVDPSNACVTPPNPMVEPTTTEYFPLTVGSFWVYESFKIDSTGLETSFSIDTTKVIGDTIINGKKFSVFAGFGLQPTSMQTYLRDSSGYIVNPNGTGAFNFFDFTTITTSVDQFISNWIRTNQLKDETSSLLSVPAGNYLTLNFLSTIHTLDGTPMDDCGNMVYAQNNNYAKNVGLVFMNYAYYSEIQSCTNREKRLINFYIAP